MKILTVFGTRPEAIKLAPVVRALQAERANLKSAVCVTGQHRQMLDQVLRLFRIEPDYDLNVMQADQSLFEVTNRVLLGLEEVFRREAPDLLLVQGDTTTTFVASLAAYYLRIPVGHVEAGLRTRNKYHPFPEEINRVLTSQLADLHFAPTERARRNLLDERVPGERIFVTGNTVIDALLWVCWGQASPARQQALETCFRDRWNLSPAADGRKLILVTGHRRENFGRGLEDICRTLKEIALFCPGVCIVYPAHLNPNVQEPVRRILDGADNLRLIDPLDYDCFVYLMSKSYLVLTDSGGIQEEAPSLGKPVLVMRDVTERPEAVEQGTAKIVGSNAENIIRETSRLLEDEEEYQRIARAVNPYGDGKAAQRIVMKIQSNWR